MMISVYCFLYFTLAVISAVYLNNEPTTCNIKVNLNASGCTLLLVTLVKEFN